MTNPELAPIGSPQRERVFARRRYGPAERQIWVCLAHVLRFLVLLGLTIVGAIPTLKGTSSAEENSNLHSMCLLGCQTSSIAINQLNPPFLSADQQMAMLFLQAPFVATKELQATQVFVPNNGDVPEGNRKHLWIAGGQSAGTYAKANVTGRKGRDGFLRGARVCDGFLHLLFFSCRKPRDVGFFGLSFGDGFLCAHEHASDGHVGAFGSQNHKD